MKVLVCGGRDFRDIAKLYYTLNAWHTLVTISLIIHGNAIGADKLADTWGKFYKVPVKSFPANWDKYGKAAGPIRNKQMLDEAKPDLVIAFAGGKGTANMVKLAKDANIPTRTIR